MDRRTALVGGLAAAALAGGGALWLTQDRECGPRLTRADLDQAVDLGVRYLLAAQLPAGDFVYEVDWTTGLQTRAYEPVRQAGAAWGLGLALVEAGDPAVAAALDRALAFWANVTRTDDQGRAWLVTQGRKDGALGTLALVALALVERLRAPVGLDEHTRGRHQQLLDGLITFVRSARLEGGGFHDAYDRTTGAARGPGNPYADGEALLLLAKAGVHLGRPELADLASQWAAADHERNVVVPRGKEPDPDQTKGYYQWGSMTWFELASSGREPERHGAWLVELAHWMIDDHHTLKRTRNTAYAYEGMLSAFAWARDHADAASADKIACVGHQGLRKLLSWQIGHRLATELQGADPPYVGGVLNEAGKPTLRIDVTQHQTHAVILARRFGLDRA